MRVGRGQLPTHALRSTRRADRAGRRTPALHDVLAANAAARKDRDQNSRDRGIGRVRRWQKTHLDRTLCGTSGALWLRKTWAPMRRIATNATTPPSRYRDRWDGTPYGNAITRR